MNDLKALLQLCLTLGLLAIFSGCSEDPPKRKDNLNARAQVEETAGPADGYTPSDSDDGEPDDGYDDEDPEEEEEEELDAATQAVRSILIYSVRRRDGGTILRLRAKGDEWKEVKVPDDRKKALIPGICAQTDATTELEFMFVYRGREFDKASPYVATMQESEKKVVLAFDDADPEEPEDNIMELTCNNGSKIKLK